MCCCSVSRGVESMGGFRARGRTTADGPAAAGPPYGYSLCVRRVRRERIDVKSRIACSKDQGSEARDPFRVWHSPFRRCFEEGQRLASCVDGVVAVPAQFDVNAALVVDFVERLEDG